MPLSAQVLNRTEITFFKGEIIPARIVSYLLTTGKLSPNDIQLGTEE